MTIDTPPGSTPALPEGPTAGAEKAEEGSPGRRDPGKRDPVRSRRVVKEEEVDGKRTIFILLGIALFAIVFFLPQPPHAVDPQGEVFELSREGKLALGLFFLA